MQTEFIPIPKYSKEFKIIQQIFIGGNCTLTEITKIYNQHKYAEFVTMLNNDRSKENVTMLFFGNTMEMFKQILNDYDGFNIVHMASPQNLVFSTDLSISYHFFTVSNSSYGNHWKSMIAGVSLKRVWNEDENYASFLLNYKEKSESIFHKGYKVIYFTKDDFYLVLEPTQCIPLYLLDFIIT